MKAKKPRSLWRLVSCWQPGKSVKGGESWTSSPCCHGQEDHPVLTSQDIQGHTQGACSTHFSFLPAFLPQQSPFSLCSAVLQAVLCCPFIVPVSVSPPPQSFTLIKQLSVLLCWSCISQQLQGFVLCWPPDQLLQLHPPLSRAPAPQDYFKGLLESSVTIPQSVSCLLVLLAQHSPSPGQQQ